MQTGGIRKAGRGQGLTTQASRAAVGNLLLQIDRMRYLGSICTHIMIIRRYFGHETSPFYMQMFI